MKIRVINKKRFYTFVAVAVIVIALAITSVAAAVYNAVATPDIVGYNTYIAWHGDTLWDIAKMSNGYGDVSHEQIVLDIREASNITPYIHCGDVIQIPIYEEGR